MLPRHGFFKNIQCPYNKANLCHRPNCHYKHFFSGHSEDTTTIVSSSYLYNRNCNSTLDLVGHRQISYSFDDKKDGGYVPTPVARCSKPVGILKAGTSFTDKQSSVPVYKPTPISKLKELNIPHGQFEEESYSPEYVGSTRKKKNVEEYDPAEIKCISKKSVSFADEAGSELIACESTFSSDEDCDDSESAPKFSDDDFDDNEQSASLQQATETSKSAVQDVAQTKEEESDIEDKKVNEFSLVDKILTETKRNEKLLKFRKRERISSKPVPLAPKVPLILKTSKVNKQKSISLEAKNFKNTDIYNMEEDSQSSIPDYSAFDSLLPPIEIDSLIKSKYDKRTFDSDATTINDSQFIEEAKNNLNEDFQLKEDSFKTISKDTDEKAKEKKCDQLKNLKVKEKTKNKKLLIEEINEKKLTKSTNNKTKSDSKNITKANNKDKYLKKLSEKVSEKKNISSSKLTEKQDDSLNNTNESKKGNTKDKVSSKKLIGTVKEHSKQNIIKPKDLEISDEHVKHKVNLNSSNVKLKPSFKEKSKPKEFSHKSGSKQSLSSSEAELQDGKVSSSCVEKKSKINVSLKPAKLSNSCVDLKSKHSILDSTRTKKPFKRKNDNSDSESNSEKEHLKSKYSFKKPKIHEAESSTDENIEENDQLLKSSYSTNVPQQKKSDVNTSDDDITFLETVEPPKSKYKNKSSSFSKKDKINKISSIDEDITISSESDYDPNEECWKIYNETFNDTSDENHENVEKKDSSKDTSSSFKDVTASGKKRFAHAAAATLKKPKSSNNKIIRQPVNPGLVMHNRYLQLMKAKESNIDPKVQGIQALNSTNKTGGRIAVPPNSSLLAAINEKKKLNQSSISDFSPLPSTVSLTLKQTKRVAHVPDMVSKPRPIIPADYGSKVPTNIRQKFLNAFIDEYLKFTAAEEEAYDKALEEEKKANQRSSSKAIYMNVASNTLARLRHKTAEYSELKSETVTSTTSKSFSKSVSHQAVLNGPLAQRTSFSIEKKKPLPVPDLKGTALYDYLLTYAMSDDQLRENGFPMSHPTESGKAVIEGIYANKTHYCNDQFKRTCSRCQKTYYVNVDGDYVRDEECDFHWGRLWKRRIAGTFESRYNCCQGDAESDGCCVSMGHVFEGSEAHAFKGYVKTLPKTPPPDKYYGIYALDCEMCYTTAGMELTRVTVIGPDLKPVYETFVKPLNKVLDYNTRFSGITEDNLKNVRTTLRDVQAVLLCIFNSRTILIGHSLESDFKALKLIHSTVVDTSIVFPHKLGLPYKRALKTLMAEKLNKIIQNEVGGHDSHEDALACMELMLYKIKEDLKGNR